MLKLCGDEKCKSTVDGSLLLFANKKSRLHFFFFLLLFALQRRRRRRRRRRKRKDTMRKNDREAKRHLSLSLSYIRTCVSIDNQSMAIVEVCKSHHSFSQYLFSLVNRFVTLTHRNGKPNAKRRPCAHRCPRGPRLL